MTLACIVLASLLAACNQSRPADDPTFKSVLQETQYQAYQQLLSSLDSFLESNYPGAPVQSQYLQFLSDFESRLFSPRATSNAKWYSSWDYSTKEVSAMVAAMEASKMRHEIRLYPHETYLVTTDVKRLLPKQSKLSVDTLEWSEINSDGEISVPYEHTLGNPMGYWDSIPTANELKRKQAADSALFGNQHGLFLYGILHTNPNSTSAQDYVDQKLAQSDVSPSILIGGFKHILSQEDTMDLGVMRQLIAVELYYPLAMLVAE